MDDDYVAQILAKEAKENSIKYSTQGLSAFMPSKPASNAPKPNTRFLRNLIKVTDSHNTALRLKEEKESRERMLKQERQENIGGMIEKIAIVHIEKEVEAVPVLRNETDRAGTDEDLMTTTSLERETSTAANIVMYVGITSQFGEIDGTKTRNTVGGDVIDHTLGLPAVLRAGTGAPIAIAIEGKTIEDLVGPLPPRQNEAPIRSRGRGAYKPNLSNIDAHFAPGYDPTTDVHLDDDNSNSMGQQSSRRAVAGLMTADDDWDMAMEALRDRERWRQKGEERLRKAGINEATISQWKNNTAFTGVDGESKPEDVQWSKKGEGREWDRGKYVNDDGHIDIRAAW
ncbi:hypothetical protein N7457_005612 [Penicillium paradoxum]|uniref:uncharacterized protein n=1 Tax=Penicillium paradoxum TaxID=176176 RepID=UPI0025474634|nr:uncharacterized protein N7457_005612 [Penicillium paradoxum]KAJ5780452.1 hypothetical protein N7457_005612 [Penicillium paradoxum]